MVVSPFSQLSRIHEFNSVIKQINRKADDSPIRMRLLGAGTGLGLADLYSHLDLDDNKVNKNGIPAYVEFVFYVHPLQFFHIYHI